jgi:protease-4
MSNTPATIELPSEIIVRHKTSWLLKLLAITGWLLAITVLAFAFYQRQQAADYWNDDRGITEHFYAGDQNSDDKIAIINIAGVIQDGHGFIKHQIDRVRDDPHVKAVVVRVNTPGGTVSGSDYIFHHLKQLKQDRDLPMVVSMGGIAASGGYYVSMAVGDEPDSIFAEPTTTTGSIGVIIPHYNVAGLLEKYDIEDDSIMSHPRKDILSISKRLPEDERALLQGYVDESFERFKTIILEGRPRFREANKDRAAGDKIEIRAASGDRDLATGEVFTAARALEFGLVDQIGFLESAIDRAAELAGLKSANVRVIKYSAPSLWIDLPYLNQADNDLLPGSLASANLLELTTPRAYFLASSFPPLLHSAREQTARRHDDP